MGFNMNSGYFGWSMSRNAVAAYEDGEKPRSKWTKAAILAAVAAYCDEFDLVPDAGLSKLTKTVGPRMRPSTAFRPPAFLPTWTPGQNSARRSSRSAPTVPASATRSIASAAGSA